MRKTQTREFPSDEEIKKAFEGTNFGPSDHKYIIKWSLLKIAAGYSTGHTARCTLQELSLLSRAKKLTLTQRGKFCLWEYFSKGYHR